MNNRNDLLIPYLFNAQPTIYSAETHGMTVMTNTPPWAQFANAVLYRPNFKPHTHTHTDY